jgi:predicted acylesterase/phospholipase RssA
MKSLASKIFISISCLATGVTSHLRGFIHEEPRTIKYKQGICNVLALSGGGAFGAVEMGMLDGLISSNQAPSSYDIITGISAGGLNAGFLSYYTNVSQALPDIYNILSGLTNADIYQSDVLNILSEWSYYNTKPLENTLSGILASKTINPNGPMTLVGASNVLSRRLDVWHFERLNLEDRVATLMATSAIPLVFPPQTINGSLYVDGGIISNEMIHQAVGQLLCDSYSVYFISASDHNSTPSPMPTGLWSYMGAVINLLVDTFDYQLAQANNCTYPRGTIQACFPDASALSNYSILDFDFGAELYALGKSSYSCSTLSLC